MNYATVLHAIAMNRGLFIVGAFVVGCVGSGAIGWNLRPECPAVDELGPATARLAVERLRDADLYADSLLKELRKPTKPVYLRVHERAKHWSAAPDDSLLLILDIGIRSE